MNGRKRLHISPLNAQLLTTVLPPPILHQASNISYHTIQTFPERDYGYVDLPDLEADKLKNKLNGSVLKGSRVRVELARQEKHTMEGKKELSSDSQLTRSNTSRRGKKVKTREEGAIPGYELPAERKVKRGWTEPATSDAKPTKRRKGKEEKIAKPKSSSLTGEAECLFKTTLPPNVPTAADTREGKDHKRKRGDSKRDVVVHEFANTTKHASFLRGEPSSKDKKPASEYIEGKGWMDEDGNTVEAPRKGRIKVETEETGPKPRRSRRSSKLETPVVENTVPKSQHKESEPYNDETSSSGTSSESESESGTESPEIPASARKATRASVRKAKGKSQGLGISEAGDNEVEVDQVERLSITRSSATPPPPQETQPTSAPATKEVHPLESLFKRPNNAASHTPKKPNLEVSTSFSFFDPEGNEGESQNHLIPQTPFTQQDIRQRRQRSAAPTPDTAAPGKTFGDLWTGTSDVSEADEDDDKEDAVAGQTEASTGLKDEKPESEFSKWFWEHRGENNRAWKRRRREAAKEKRQKDNKERRG